MSAPVTNSAMPVIRDLRDFDRNSGNLLERFIFNNRAVALLLCLAATVVLGFQRSDKDMGVIPVGRCKK